MDNRKDNSLIAPPIGRLRIIETPRPVLLGGWQSAIHLDSCTQHRRR